MTRQLPPTIRGALDTFRFSPIAKAPAARAEYKAAWEAVQTQYPGVKLTYIGTDGRQHFFQEHGVPESYVVPLQDPAFSVKF